MGRMDEETHQRMDRARCICGSPFPAVLVPILNATETFVQGTILLNANVAFLAIQSVDVNSPTHSSAQIASYSSTIASIGSIAIGLLLIRRVRSREVRSDMVRLSNRIQHGAR